MSKEQILGTSEFLDRHTFFWEHRTFARIFIFGFEVWTFYEGMARFKKYDALRKKYDVLTKNFDALSGPSMSLGTVLST